MSDHRAKLLRDAMEARPLPDASEFVGYTPPPFMECPVCGEDHRPIDAGRDVLIMPCPEVPLNLVITGRKAEA